MRGSAAAAAAALTGALALGAAGAATAARTGAATAARTGAATAARTGAATAAGTAVSTTGVDCGSVKTGIDYKPSSRGLFGARNISETGTTCAVAKPLAARYVENPYSVDQPSKNTKTVNGFRCTWTPNNKVAQTVNVSCTKGSATVTFADRLPNG